MKTSRRRIRMVNRQRQKLSRRTIAMMSACAFLLISGGFFTFFNLGRSQKSVAATVGDYRSKAVGSWNNTSTWEVFNGVSWVGAFTTPTSSNAGTITIQSPYNVTVSSNITADQIIVSSGAQLIVSSGTLTIANGTGTDLDVAGTISITSTLTLNASSSFNISGTGTLNAGGTLNINAGALTTVLNGGTFNQNGGTQTTSAGWAINNGGTYVHNANGKTIPTATWGSSSTIKITGVTTSDITGLSQNFGNFIYNCTLQSGVIQFWDQLSSIQGDLTIQSTGSSTLYLQRISTTGIVTLSGNYIQTGGTVYMTKGAVYTMSVGGNFTITGGTCIETERYGAPTLNIYGNFIINGGTFNHSTYNSNITGEGIGTVNLFGNYLISSGSHTETATLTGRGDFNFAKTGTQTFIITGGSITNVINFTVNSGAILDLSTYAITSAGTFTLSSGGGLILASPNGITSASASGNVQVTGTRSFSTGGDYTYNASSAQVTGDGLPATIHNLTINNSSGVTLSGSTSATNIITLTNGIVTTGASYELGITNPSTTSIVGYSAANYVIGNLRRSINGTGAYDFPLGTTAYYEPANLEFFAATGLTDVVGNFTNTNPLATGPLNNVYCNGTYVDDMLDYGYWVFTPNVVMSGGTYTVTLNEKGATNAGDNPLALCVLKRANGASPWASIGTHNNNTQSINNGTATAARSALTGFSHFGIGKTTYGSLPIKLIYFKARLGDGVVNLDWATSAEVNNNYFTVERSDDGEHFVELLRKTGAGNSTSTLYYKYKDTKPLEGYSYYRLKQTDYDGHYTYSDIQTVKSGTGPAGEMDKMEIKTISPNPFTENFKVSFMIKQAVVVDFSLMNSSGQFIAQEKIQAEEGMNTYEFIDRYNLKKGIYYVTLVYNDQRVTQKIIKN